MEKWLGDNSFLFLLAFSLGFLTSSLFMLAAVRIAQAPSNRRKEAGNDNLSATKNDEIEMYRQVLYEEGVSEIVSEVKNKHLEKTR